MVREEEVPGPWGDEDRNRDHSTPEVKEEPLILYDVQDDPRVEGETRRRKTERVYPRVRRKWWTMETGKTV